jgi:hypothetical protein
MKKYQITDSDIVDAILGQATSPTEESVQAAREDSGFAATFDEWTRIIASAKSEAPRVKATTQRMNANVMESIRQEALIEPASASGQSGFGAQWLLRISRRRVLMPLTSVLAACLFLAVVAPKLFQNEVSIPVKSQFTYVDFSISETADIESVNSPYNTLEKAIQATSKGGTIFVRPAAGDIILSKTMLIAKPLRIQSQNVSDGAG